MGCPTRTSPRSSSSARRRSRATCGTSSRSSRPTTARRPSRSPCANRSSSSDEGARPDRADVSVHEIVLDVLLAVALGVLAALALRARGSRQRAERNVEAERALREQVSAQADALDRLLAATTGLADELDEGRLLERIAEEAVELVSAECGLVLERTDNRCTVVTSAPLGQAWRPAAFDAASATDLAKAHGGAVEVTPLPVPSLQGGALAVLRSSDAPFSAVERAQLRVFAA